MYPIALKHSRIWIYVLELRNLHWSVVHNGIESRTICTSHRGIEVVNTEDLLIIMNENMILFFVPQEVQS